MTTRTYFFDWSPMFHAFINERKVDGHQIINDSDVLVVRLECHNDTALAVLLLEYAQWLSNAQHDMSVNPEASGSMYHASPQPPVQW
jgi:hypothetical protein